MSVEVSRDTVFADRDPTASDDVASHGYCRGQWWVNTTSGAVFVMSGEVAKRAVWEPAVHAAVADAVVALTASVAAIPLNNSAAAAPGVSNDSSEGYSAFSQWIDTRGPDVYVCTSAAVGAASWAKVYDAP